MEKLINALNTTTEEMFANEHLKETDFLVENIENNLKIIKDDRKKLEIVYKFVSFILNI